MSCPSDTALETVRSLCGLGCTIEPPPTSSSGGSSIHDLRRKQADHTTMQTRTFRAQRCYTVTRGRWYKYCNILILCVYMVCVCVCVCADHITSGAMR